MVSPSADSPDDARRQLHEASERLRTLTENAFDLITEVDEQGVYLYLSPNHRTALGWDIDEMLGKNALDIVHPRQRESIERRLREAAQEGSGIAEVQVRSADGQWRWLESTGKSYHTADGNLRFVVISRDISARKQTEALLRREQEHQRRLVALLDCERRLMAYEIHDGLVQDLFGSQLFLESINAAGLPDLETRQILESALRLLRGAIEEARRLINGLRPPVLDEKGLVPALEHLIEDTRHTWRLEVEFQAEVQFDRLSPAIENSIYRIVQESLSNVRKHSDAERASVAVTQLDRSVQITVEDQGKGFDPQNVTEKHFGLEGIRERARLLNGEAEVFSRPGQGTRISVRLPMHSVEDPRAQS